MLTVDHSADHCVWCSGATLGIPLILAESDGVAPVNGSPQDVVEQGVQKGAALVAPWLEALVEAGTVHVDSSVGIEGRLWVAAQRLNIDPLAEHLYERLLRGVMLGALDAAWEADHGEVIAPAQFEGAAIGPSGGVKDFVTKPFKEAIEDFKARKIVTRDVFDGLSAEAKKKAFTIAGVVRDDVLQTAHAELLSTIEQGKDLRQFGAALNERFKAAGHTELSPTHLETVFRTNVASAYGNGRTEQMRQPHVLAARPYWQVTGPKDGVAPQGRSRPTHYAARGKVLRADDPFWQTAGAPPWGYNCRCRVISRSAKDLERLGLSVSTGADLAGLPDEGFESRRLPAPEAPAPEAQEGTQPKPQQPVARSKPARVQDAPRVKPDAVQEPPGGLVAYSETAAQAPLLKREQVAVSSWSENDTLLSNADRMTPDELVAAHPNTTAREIVEAQRHALDLNNAVVQEANLTAPAPLYVDLGAIGDREADRLLGADVVRLDSLTKATHDAGVMVTDTPKSTGTLRHVLAIDEDRGIAADGATGNPKAGVILRGGTRYDVYSRERVDTDDNGTLDTLVLRGRKRKPDVLPPVYDTPAPTAAAIDQARKRLAVLPSLGSKRVANPVPVLRTEDGSDVWTTLLPQEQVASIKLLQSEAEQRRWPLVDVPVESLVTTQDFVRSADVDKLLETPDAPSRMSAYPAVVRLQDGRLVVADGNHRSAAHKLLSRKLIRVRLIEAASIPRLLLP